MNKIVLEKFEKLKNILKSTQGCAIAYSGGVDSSLLLAAAYEILGGRTLSVIATSSTYPQREFERAVQWVKENNIPYTVIESEELVIPNFSDNPPNRCYHCKKELFTKVAQEAHKRSLNRIADGTNADDPCDYRPGMRAAHELNVLSPLKEAGLNKEDIRIIAREVYQLPMADAPAMACLASRFPYGNKITPEKLKQVEQMESMLHDSGFSQCRARHYNDTLCIELLPSQLTLLVREDLRKKCIDFAHTLGFTYITLDLQGYRTGSMNEVLEKRN